MSKRIFSSEEQKLLQSNPNIERCSPLSITYTTAFKEHAVACYEHGMSSVEIFKEAGIDINLIGKTQPKQCLLRWRRRFKKDGFAGLVEARGKQVVTGRKTSRNSETDRLKWLEAEVAYLKAENAFLAQLRAKRAE